jgi:SAM-dependent methyltransferase
MKKTKTGIYRYLAFAKDIYEREIKKQMPWYRMRLRKKGSRFVLNYSDEGDARLVLYPIEGDKVSIVPVGDREYEYAYVIEKLREYGIKGKTILDVGSSGSVLPTILAALGNHAVCVDVREWPVKWHNVEFVKGDVIMSENLFPFESFDVITCISTIEHFGLGRYGDAEDVDGDIKGLAKIRKYLKPDGLMILTTPCGVGAVAFPAHRIYNKSRFLKLVSGFKILDMKFFGPIDNPAVYRPCSEEEAYSIDPQRGNATICSLLQKQEGGVK